MSPWLSDLFVGWSVALFAAIVVFLQWKLRRYATSRRLSKGLRAYAGALR